MNTTIPAFRLLIVLTVLTGVAYPLAMIGIGQALFKDKVNGAIVKRGDTVVGSKLIAQAFRQDRYFWPRPSAVDFNPIPSGASNLGPTAKKLKEQFDARAKAYHAPAASIPQDLLFASGSGLDPHISPAAAHYQVDRVAAAREISETGKARIHGLIDSNLEHRQLGFLGEPRVNVLLLNLKLDEMK